MIPNPATTRKVSDGKKWLLRHVPYYGRWYRFFVLAGFRHGHLAFVSSIPSRDHPGRAVNAANEMMRASSRGSWRVRSATTGAAREGVPEVSRRSSSACCRTTEAGCGAEARERGARHRRHRRDRARRDRARTARVTRRRDRLRDRLPREPVPLADGDRRPRRRHRSASSGAKSRARISGSRCRGSRTSSASTARARTSRTAAASSSTPNARFVT